MPAGCDGENTCGKNPLYVPDVNPVGPSHWTSVAPATFVARHPSRFAPAVVRLTLMRPLPHPALASSVTPNAVADAAASPGAIATSKTAKARIIDRDWAREPISNLCSFLDKGE